MTKYIATVKKSIKTGLTREQIMPLLRSELMYDLVRSAINISLREVTKEDNDTTRIKESSRTDNTED